MEFPMIYTEWLINSFPKLKEAPSTETFSYIHQAKLASKLQCWFIDISLTVAFMVCFTFIMSSVGYIPFESYIYWAGLVIVLAISKYISDKIEQKIIKNKLYKLVIKKYA
jgi:hypothetical protein